MSIFLENSPQHTLHFFDVELDNLHGMLLNITEVLAIQLELSTQSLEKNNSQYAMDSISLIEEIESIKINIDSEIPTIIARFCPVANDLRTVITVSKIADHLKNIGDGIAEFAFFTKALLTTPYETSSLCLFANSIEMGRHILWLLNEIKSSIYLQEITSLYNLIAGDYSYETKFHNQLKEEFLQFIDNKDYNGATNIMTIINLLNKLHEELRAIFIHVILNQLSDCRFRHKWISESAYYMAEHRNFVPGFDLSDWLNAENEFQALVTQAKAMTGSIR